MISIVLLLKLVGGICFIFSWVYMYRCIRQTRRRLEYLKAYCDERLDAIVRDMEQSREEDTPENGALAETRRRAQEAERLFTEGIASILNFSSSSARDVMAGNSHTDDLAAGCSAAGKKVI